MLQLPLAGTCDCHVHIVGPLDRFPQIATRKYTAAKAELNTLRAVAEPSGVTRFVVVQPSFYGTENACLFSTLDAVAGRGRGVVAIDLAAATPHLFAEYGRRCVCGIRLNVYSPMSAPGTGDLAGALASWMEKLPPSGWHIEIVAPLSTLASAASAISQSSVPIVIDHYGLPGDVLPDSREGRCLVDLAALPHVWVKLSAPYRIGGDPLATAPPAVWLDALLQAAPERCVWGSDWPHTPAHTDQKGLQQETPHRKIEYARLLGDFGEAVSDHALVRRILIDNPARLYGFPQS